MVVRARHVEGAVQILGVMATATIHLFERDCSGNGATRRVVERVPAPISMLPAARNPLPGCPYVFAAGAGYTPRRHGGNFSRRRFRLLSISIEVNPRIQVGYR